jgi:hypothetical protein
MMAVAVATPVAAGSVPAGPVAVAVLITVTVLQKIHEARIRKIRRYTGLEEVFQDIANARSEYKSYKRMWQDDTDGKLHDTPPKLRDKKKAGQPQVKRSHRPQPGPMDLVLHNPVLQSRAVDMGLLGRTLSQRPAVTPQRLTTPPADWQRVLLPAEHSAYRYLPEQWVWMDANGNYRGEADPPPAPQTEDDDAGKPCACVPGGRYVWANSAGHVLAPAPDDDDLDFLTPEGYLNFQALVPEFIQLPGIAPGVPTVGMLSVMNNLPKFILDQIANDNSLPTDAPFKPVYPDAFRKITDMYKICNNYVYPYYVDSIDKIGNTQEIYTLDDSTDYIKYIKGFESDTVEDKLFRQELREIIKSSAQRVGITPEELFVTLMGEGFYGFIKERSTRKIEGLEPQLDGFAFLGLDFFHPTGKDPDGDDLEYGYESEEFKPSPLQRINGAEDSEKISVSELQHSGLFPTQYEDGIHYHAYPQDRLESPYGAQIVYPARFDNMRIAIEAVAAVYKHRMKQLEKDLTTLGIENIENSDFKILYSYFYYNNPLLAYRRDLDRGELKTYNTMKKVRDIICTLLKNNNETNFGATKNTKIYRENHPPQMFLKCYKRLVTIRYIQESGIFK